MDTCDNRDMEHVNKSRLAKQIYKRNWRFKMTMLKNVRYLHCEHCRPGCKQSEFHKTACTYQIANKLNPCPKGNEIIKQNLYSAKAWTQMIEMFCVRCEHSSAHFWNRIPSKDHVTTLCLECGRSTTFIPTDDFNEVLKRIENQ